MARGECNPQQLDGRDEGRVRKMRQRRDRVVSRLLVGVVLAVVLLAASTGSAGAKNIKHPKNNTCTGSADNFPTELGTLSGTYSGHVKISGACAVDAGPTTINGNLTIGKGSTLIALFASSPLTVTGNTISSEAIAQIVAETAFECYGVVGMKGSLRGQLARARGRPRGIEIGRHDGEVTVDLHVVVEYGLNLAEVASSVSNRVAYEVQRLTGLRVRAVEVHVDDVRTGGK